MAKTINEVALELACEDINYWVGQVHKYAKREDGKDLIAHFRKLAKEKLAKGRKK